MWINRREFLKLSGITTAGAFLGGIPLLNGCKSNPDKLKGAKESTTICPFCSVGCGLIVSSRDKKIINIEGDPDHPINRGALCSKGNALYQLTVNKKRLKKVQYRTPYSNKWKDISWEEALKMIAMRIKKTRDDTLVEKEGIYTVNRTNGIVGLGGAALNNEECYVWSKMARILGISYLEHEARNHHSASIASLSNTFGHGAMTNHWIDIQHADVIMIIGSNAAENHPISFKYVTKAMENGGKLISVDPRFTRTSSLSHIFAPLRPGTDITFINGIINYALKNDMIQKEYVVEYTNASFLVNPDFEFNDGLFSGYNTKKKEYTDKSSWKHQLNAKGIPIRDKTLKNSNCVYQLMKKHFSRYTPEEVSAVTGCPINIFIKIAELYTSTHKPDRVATIMYSMGATQHSVGTQNIRTYAILQLLMGNIGLAGGGINALSGESNMQGSTDHSILWDTLPGYLDIPKTKKDLNLKAYNKNNTPKSNDPMSINSWKFKPKYIVSLLKAFYGDAASEENDFCYDWLPKASKLYPHIVLFEDMYAGMHKGAIIMGTNPVVGGPHSNKETKALEKLDWLVAADNWETETAAFWKRPGANPKTIKTEVFLLPAASSIEKEGSISNSGRWAQWRYKAVEPPGEVKDELWIIDRIFKEVRKLYKKDKNAKFSDPILKAYWNFTKEGEDHPDPHLVAKEINGFEWGTKTLIKNLTKLKDDGSTACGNWLYSGSYTEEGNLMARRGMEDAPNELGMYPQWSWCWPANRRIIYNRASVDRDGNPWNKDKPVVKWTGNNWEGDIIDGDGAPDIRNPFPMLPEGVGKLFAKELADGPLPEHYEPMESPVKNIMNSQNLNPTVKIIPFTKKEYGNREKYPYIATLYQISEHWQAGGMTRNLPWLTELVPNMFCEISPELAKKKGIMNGDRVRITSARGSIKSYALVTERIQPFNINGEIQEMIGLIWHFGFSSDASGDIANILTPHIGDPNTMIPEFKAFLVDIKKV